MPVFAGRTLILLILSFRGSDVSNVYEGILYENGSNENMQIQSAICDTQVSQVAKIFNILLHNSGIVEGYLDKVLQDSCCRPTGVTVVRTRELILVCDIWKRRTNIVVFGHTCSFQFLIEILLN